MRAAVSVVALAVLLAAGPAAGGASAASGSSAAVEITDRLQPAAVTIAAGGTVRWSNADDERHRVRSESGPERFDSGNLAPGETWAETFSVPGEYRYVDARDPDDPAYWGTVTVTGQDAAGAPSSGSSEPAASGPAGGGGAPGSISMGDRTFSPASVTVGVGAAVSWVNDSDREHTVTADDGSFDSGQLPPGARFTRAFDRAGSYGYFCALHGGMRGTVVVGNGAPGTRASAGDAGAPPSAAATAPDVVAAAPGEVVLEVRDFSFDPGAVEVAAGTTVLWRHVGDAPHTVTDEGGTFDSGFIDAGGSFSHTFDQPGAYPYVCALHPQMTGEVTVLAADGAAAPAPVAAPAAAPAVPHAADADPASSVAGVLPGVGLLVAGLLVSAALLAGAWRVRRALHRRVSPGAPPPAPHQPGRT